MNADAVMWRAGSASPRVGGPPRPALTMAPWVFRYAEQWSPPRGGGLHNTASPGKYEANLGHRSPPDKIAVVVATSQIGENLCGSFKGIFIPIT